MAQKENSQVISQEIKRNATFEKAISIRNVIKQSDCSSIQNAPNIISRIHFLSFPFIAHQLNDMTKCNRHKGQMEFDPVPSIRNITVEFTQLNLRERQQQKKTKTVIQIVQREGEKSSSQKVKCVGQFFDQNQIINTQRHIPDPIPTLTTSLLKPSLSVKTKAKCRDNKQRQNQKEGGYRKTLFRERTIDKAYMQRNILACVENVYGKPKTHQFKHVA